MLFLASFFLLVHSFAQQACATRTWLAGQLGGALRGAGVPCRVAEVAEDFEWYLERLLGTAPRDEVILEEGGSKVPGLSPVVLVGGFLTSDLFADVDKSSSEHWYCATHLANVQLWPNLMNLAPGRARCWMENMRLLWDARSGEYVDNGVNVRTAPIGGTDGVSFGIWDTFLKAFASQGYTKSNVKVAKFDWRLGPREWQKDFPTLRAMIEDQGRVTLLSFSQGSLYVRHFLASVDSEWKDQHIESWATVSGIFKGTPELVEHIIYPTVSATEFLTAVPWVDMKDLRNMTISWSAMYAMLPASSLVTSEALITTRIRNYTHSELPQAFADAGIGATANSLYALRGPHVMADELLPAPGVDVHCLYATGKPTVSALHYNDGFDSPPSSYSYSPGDGRVVEESLAACRNWAERDSAHSVDVHTYTNLSHLAMLKDAGPVAYVAGLLSKTQQKMLNQLQA